MSPDKPEMPEVSDRELTTMLRKAAEEGPQSADHFFGSFGYVRELLKGDFSAALDQGISLLLKCQSLDHGAYVAIHKGTPFYWLGTAAFLLHDHQTATFFYDAAVSEDLRAGADPVMNPTPALHFIQIDGAQPNQAARNLVRMAQARVEDVINEYNSMPGRSTSVPELTIHDLREFFLRPAVSPGLERWRSLATTFISFLLEWDYRSTLLDLRADVGTSEPFFIHLFKGCVLFESLLKTNPNHQVPAGVRSLGQVLQLFHSLLGIPHNISIGNTDFPTILHDLGNADNRIQTAIEFAGRIRNTVGHNLGWGVNLDKNQYSRLVRMVATSCLHAIACLYR